MVDVDATLTRWREDPVAFVVENFQVEPDPWQLEALRAFPSTQRLALKACKGPGKTSLLAWLGLNFISTRPYARIGATSISAENLSDNLWGELRKWQAKSPFLSARFTWTKTRFESIEDPGNWYMTARSWPRSADPQRQADTLAGLHADHTLYLLDESSGIPNGVMATALAVLSGGQDCKVVQSGNPTQTEGPLWRACNEDRHLWTVIEITGDPDDPKRSPRIDLAYAKEQVQTYGRDNPWVMVNILGKFPPTSLNALLGPDEVQAAMKRHLREDEYDWSQKRIGIDVARFGDDRTVLFPRQGQAAFRPVVLRNARTTDIAARCAQAATKWDAEVLLVDDTGHWGHGVIDNLVSAGYSPIGIQYHGQAQDPRYKNARAEMWMRMADWVKAGGALPDLPELVGELTTPTYTFVGGKFQLEDKDLVKMRLGRSPDLADALANTFYLADQPGQMRLPPNVRQPSKVLTEFDPFRETERDQPAVTTHDWNPLA